LKKILLIIIIIILMFSFAGCNEDAKSETEGLTKGGSSTVENAPKPTPEPLPVATEIFATNGSIYKLFDNGEYGYIGNGFGRNIKRLAEESLKQQKAEAGIPIVVEQEWELNYIKEQHPDWEVYMNTDIDSREYEAEYGEKIDRLESSLFLNELEQSVPISIQSSLGSRSNVTAYLYSVESKSGLVAIEMRATYVDGDHIYGDFNTSKAFSDEVIIDVAAGPHFVIGLTEDGRALKYLPEVIIDKKNGNEDETYSDIDITGWSDLIDIDTGANHIVGLKSDGTVIASGNDDFGQCNVVGWTDIIAVSAGDNHTVGLKEDGTVVACGDNELTQCDVGEWKDIEKIVTSQYSTAGLTSGKDVIICGGSEIPVGWSSASIPYSWQPTMWEEIVDIFAFNNSIVSLDSAGEVKCVNAANSVLYNKDWQSGIQDIGTDPVGFTIKRTNDILRYSKKEPEAENIEETWQTLSEDFLEYDVLKPYVFFQFFDEKKYSLISEGSFFIIERDWETKEMAGREVDYKADIVDYAYMGNGFVALAENGDVLKIDERVSTGSGEDKVPEHKVIGKKAVDMAKFTKMAASGNAVAFLYNDGSLVTIPMSDFLFNPDFYIYDMRYENWDLDKGRKSTNSGTGDSSITNDDMLEINNWEDFIGLYGDGMPAFDVYGMVHGYGYYQDFYNAWEINASFNISDPTEFESFTQTAIDAGYEQFAEEESTIFYTDQEEYPMYIRSFYSSDFNSEFNIVLYDTPNPNINITFFKEDVEGYEPSAKSSSSGSPEFEDIESWDDFTALFGSDMPLFREGSFDSGSSYYSEYHSANIAQAYYSNADEAEFNSFKQLAISAGFKNISEEESYFTTSGSDEQYPMFRSTFSNETNGKEFEISYMVGDYPSIIVSFEF